MDAQNNIPEQEREDVLPKARLYFTITLFCLLYLDLPLLAMIYMWTAASLVVYDDDRVAPADDEAEYLSHSNANIAEVLGYDVRFTDLDEYLAANAQQSTQVVEVKKDDLHLPQIKRIVAKSLSYLYINNCMDYWVNQKFTNYLAYTSFIEYLHIIPLKQSSLLYLKACGVNIFDHFFYINIFGNYPWIYIERNQDMRFKYRNHEQCILDATLNNIFNLIFDNLFLYNSVKDSLLLKKKLKKLSFKLRTHYNNCITDNILQYGNKSSKLNCSLTNISPDFKFHGPQSNYINFLAHYLIKGYYYNLQNQTKFICFIDSDMTYMWYYFMDFIQHVYFKQLNGDLNDAKNNDYKHFFNLLYIGKYSMFHHINQIISNLSGSFSYYISLKFIEGALLKVAKLRTNYLYWLFKKYTKYMKADKIADPQDDSSFKKNFFKQNKIQKYDYYSNTYEMTKKRKDLREDYMRVIHNINIYWWVLLLQGCIFLLILNSTASIWVVVHISMILVLSQIIWRIIYNLLYLVNMISYAP